MLNFDLEKLINILEIDDLKDRKMLEKAYELNCRCEQMEGNSLYNHICNETALLLYIDFKADLNTVLASLIYHSVKTLNIPESDVRSYFNDDIVNKVSQLIKFDNNLLCSNINDRLLMTKSIIDDVKVTIIKLVERVSIFHNINNIPRDFIIDTLEFYVPISKLLGIYKIKNNLEDLCFRYDENYEATYAIKRKIEKEYNKVLKSVMDKFKSSTLNFKDDVTFKFNQRSNYEIYKKALEADKKVKQLNNNNEIKLSGFCSVQCLTKEKQQCYLMIYLIHQFNHYMGSFNDFISGYQGNEYKAIHTNVFIASNLVDFRICTEEMNRVNLYGLVSDWEKDKDLQKRLKENYSFYDQLLSLNNSNNDLALLYRFITEIVDTQIEKNEYINISHQKALKYHNN